MEKKQRERDRRDRKRKKGARFEKGIKNNNPFNIQRAHVKEGKGRPKD